MEVARNCEHNLDMFHDTLKLYWFIFSLHGRGVKSISPVLELDNITLGVSHREVVLRTQVLQRLWDDIQLYQSSLQDLLTLQLTDDNIQIVALFIIIKVYGTKTQIP